MSRYQDIFNFFRMGLVTGLVTPKELITWADREILASDIPQEEVMELAFSERKSLSQQVYLLNHFQGNASYDPSLKWLFARAWCLLEQDPELAVKILQGLRLLNAEMYLPDTIRKQITGLDSYLALYKDEQISSKLLHTELIAFLQPYESYLDQVNELI